MYLPLAPAFTATLQASPGGSAATYHTVRQMRSLVKSERILPFIINKAVGVIHFAVQKDELSEIDALFKFVRDNVRYVKDVAGLETLSTPTMTLQRMVGDCDDQATLLATLLESVGYPTRFIMTAYQQNQEYEHVYLEVFSSSRNMWFPLDPTEFFCVGWEAPHNLIKWIENV
jgi:transglutaminase-like putative cysteine protease